MSKVHFCSCSSSTCSCGYNSQVADVGMSLCTSIFKASWQFVDACCCTEAKINTQLWQCALLDKVSLFPKPKPLHSAYF